MIASYYSGLSVIELLLNKQRLEETLLSLYISRPDLAPSILALFFYNRYERHGYNVALSMNNILYRLGFEIDPHIIPLQNLFRMIFAEQDSNGNCKVLLEVDVNSLVEHLQNYPQQKVVNFSFQIGPCGIQITTTYKRLRQGFTPPSSITDEETGLVYIGAVGITTINGSIVRIDANGNPVQPVTKEEYDRIMQQLIQENTETETLERPLIEIIGAYENDEEAIENLRQLFSICENFPEKLFVAAIGNGKEDLTRVREILRDEWPENLILVGAWTINNHPLRETHGAEVYVPNHELGIETASSYAVPVISALCAILLRNQPNLSPSEIKRIILRNYTDPIEYQGYDSSTGTHTTAQARVLNLKKVVSSLHR